ncbi:MAG TPA: C69 family dipeptidase, partial [Cyclobacteriaceae bacterium]|nr:C69 family dipeptidase [Cyclobacteriaceae bacterium]
GANEHGVVIGNEAVFTKVKFEKHNNGLTGMDLLRLALERSKSAHEALHCITTLLEQYGQNACGGYKNKKFYYHNSFIIADYEAAWILETAGKVWAAKKVKDISSISNGLSITVDADVLSNNAQSFAQDKAWWKTGTTFNFQKAYSDWLYTKLGRASVRSACTVNLATTKRGTLTAFDCMQILQTHNVEDPKFKPSRASTASICMHATGILNPSQTTGSMVAQIRRDKPHTIWLSGTSMPCLSLYLPFYFGTDTLAKIKSPGAASDDSLWWQAEQLHRWICKDYQHRKSLFNEAREQLQQNILKEEQIIISSNPTTQALNDFSNNCLEKYHNTLDTWLSKMK